MFDEPVEHAVEWIFHRGFELVGGPSAVGPSHAGHVKPPVDDRKKEL